MNTAGQFTGGTGQLTIYSGLTELERAQLDALAHVKAVAIDAYLLHQHSPAKYVYVLQQGVMVMERSSASGKRQILAFIYPGNFIGITHTDFYEFSVQALSPARVAEIPRHHFLQLADSMPQLKSNVSRIGGNVLAHALDQVFALGQKKAHERLCFFLNQLLTRNQGRPGRIELVMTRQDIADYLGLTIETVSRAFAKLKREGIVAIYSAHTVEILDIPKLLELAQAD